MKVKFKNKLSVKVVLLTLLMASMTLLSSAAGVVSLTEFKEEYQRVKELNFDLLLKVTELKVQTTAIIRTSTEMLLSKDTTELQWDLLKVSDRKLWADKLFGQLENYLYEQEELLVLKSRLYVHLDEIAHVVTKKFEYSDQFFKLYGQAETLKKETLKKGDMQFFIILDNAISHFNPIINKQLEMNKEADVNALKAYIKKISTQLSEEENNRLQSLFLSENSLLVSYQNFAGQLEHLEAMRITNEEFTDLFVSATGENVTRIQDHFMDKLSRLEHELNKRKNRLYTVVFSCLLATLFLVLIQLDFVRRIEFIRKIIVAGDSARIIDLPIKGKDEISQMALSVKAYIERLIVKEKEILEANKQLEHLASHDGLTGIYNRRYFETFLSQENTRYGRYEEVYCIAMIDLDFFKRINDTHGHDAGDMVLIEFVERVKSIVRKTDIFARFGGEEFVLLLPNTTEKNALMLMERIREEIDCRPCYYHSEAINFTVSIGLTEVQASLEHDAFKHVSLADKALYEAKDTGRNKVCVFGE